MLAGRRSRELVVGNSASSASLGRRERPARRDRAGGPSVRRSAWAAPPAGDPGVVARAQHLGHGPAPELGRPRVLRVLEPPVGERLLGRRRLVAHDARHQPRHRLDHDERRGLAAGEDEVADRQLAVAEMVGDPLVDALVATADQREPVARRELRAPAPGRTGARSPTATAAAAAGCTASTAANSGSGVITMPAPPPNGASSTLRWRSVVNARGSCRFARRARPRARARPSSDTPQRRVEVLGEDREDVDAHGAGQAARGRTGRRAGRRRPRRTRTTRRTPSAPARRRRARADRARGSPRPRRRCPSAAPARSRTSEPMSSCTHSSPSGGSASGSASTILPRSASAPSRSSTPSKRTTKRCCCGREADYDHERTTVDPQASTRARTAPRCC